MSGGRRQRARSNEKSPKSANASASENPERGAPSQPARIGDIMVRMGVLTAHQRDEVLEAQRLSPRPFGVLAEELFGVSPSAVERAWARQYAQMAPKVDPSAMSISDAVAGKVSRRQAWQFRVLPISFMDNELVVATTEECLPKAMRFMAWRTETPVSFVLADAPKLGEALCKVHPMGGMRPSDVMLEPRTA